MQLSNSLSGVILPRGRDEHSRAAFGHNESELADISRNKPQPNKPINHDAVLSPRSNFKPAQSLNAANYSEYRQTHPVFIQPSTQQFSNQGRAAISIYQGVAEALPPQKVELLGIDVFA